MKRFAVYVASAACLLLSAVCVSAENRKIYIMSRSSDVASQISAAVRDNGYTPVSIADSRGISESGPVLIGSHAASSGNMGDGYVSTGGAVNVTASYACVRAGQDTVLLYIDAFAQPYHGAGPADQVLSSIGKVVSRSFIEVSKTAMDPQLFSKAANSCNKRK
jgi:hypothetical protein